MKFRNWFSWFRNFSIKHIQKDSLFAFQMCGNQRKRGCAERREKKYLKRKHILEIYSIVYSCAKFGFNYGSNGVIVSELKVFILIGIDVDEIQNGKKIALHTYYFVYSILIWSFLLCCSSQFHEVTQIDWWCFVRSFVYKVLRRFIYGFCSWAWSLQTNEIM